MAVSGQLHSMAALLLGI